MWADPITLSIWRSVYLTDPRFRRETCIVAAIDDAVVGFVLGMTPAGHETSSAASGGDAWIVGFGVHSAFRRQGIGTRLFEALSSEVRERGLRRIVVGPYIPSYVAPGVDVSAYADAIAFLCNWGALTLSKPLSMKASLTGYRMDRSPRPGQAEVPESSLEVREATGLNVLPCLEFVGREFPHWSPDVSSVASRIFGGDTNSATLFVAYIGGQLTGFAMSRGERFGPFGVQEASRGRGIGTALLASTLMAMRSLGFHCAWFLWTDDRAARLYQHHGFEEVRRFALMAKEVHK